MFHVPHRDNQAEYKMTLLVKEWRFFFFHHSASQSNFSIRLSILESNCSVGLEHRSCKLSLPLLHHSVAIFDSYIMSSTSGIVASCPQNVTFYACDFGERFLGCCENGSSADICTHGCPPEDLLPASFETEYYDYITTAACTRGDWWSCANTSPPFLGCCLSNPCSGGCPRSNLTAAIFSQNQTENPLYSAISDTPAAASSTTSSFTSTAASSTLVRTTVGAHSATTSPLSVQKNSTRDIVGGVVGGIVAMGGIFIGVLLLYRCLKSQGYKGPDSSGTSKQGSSKGTSLDSLAIAAILAVDILQTLYLEARRYQLLDQGHQLLT